MSNEQTGTPSEQANAAPKDPRDMTPSELLDFDPFEKFGATDGSDGETGTAHGDAGQQTGEEEGIAASGDGGEQPPERDAQGAAATQGSTNEDIAALRQQIVDLRNQLATAVAPQQGQQPQHQQQPEGRDQRTEEQRNAELLSQYSFNLPPQLVEAIRSDDPAVATQGISQLMAGLGASIHRNVEQKMSEMVRRVITHSVPQMIQQTSTQRETAKRVFDDFYGTYTDLNDPRLYGVVVSTAAQVGRELAKTGWDAQLKEETAKRVYALLGKPMPGTTPPADTKKQGKGRQPAMTPAGRSRAQAAPAGENSPEAVADVLGL